MEPSSPQATEVTREELFRQVWSTPMSKLAVQYGLSGNGLAKICDRMLVPYPPRGYWAKKAAGKKVVEYRLPPAKPDTPTRTTIRPTSPPPPEPVPPAALDKMLARVRKKPGSAVVAERLARPHAIIAGWHADRESRRRTARTDPDPWRRQFLDPGAWSEVDKRKHRFFDALFKALEYHGGKVREGQRRELLVELEGQTIEFQIREKQKQVRRPLTASEKKSRLPGERDWRQELQPSGKLVFAFKTYLPHGYRQEWLETDDTPLEDLLPDILATFLAVAPALAERQREREAAEKQRLVEERIRYEEQQRRKTDDNRWRKFLELSDHFRRLADARAFVEALRQAQVDPDATVDGTPLSEWLAWAEERLTAADPLKEGSASVFETVSKINSWSY